MPILGSSNSAANKDMMSNKLTNWNTIFKLSRKHCGKRRNCSLTLYSISTHFDASTTDSFWKHWGKRRNCSWRAISPFPTMLSTQSDNCTAFVHIFDIIFLFAPELEEPKIGIWGKGLRQFLLFLQWFQKLSCWCVKMSIYRVKS